MSVEEGGRCGPAEKHMCLNRLGAKKPTEATPAVQMQACAQVGAGPSSTAREEEGAAGSSAVSGWSPPAGTPPQGSPPQTTVQRRACVNELGPASAPLSCPCPPAAELGRQRPGCLRGGPAETGVSSSLIAVRLDSGRVGGHAGDRPRRPRPGVGTEPAAAAVGRGGAVPALNVPRSFQLLVWPFSRS